VLVRVIWKGEFIGYAWLDADAVNYLHGIASPEGSLVSL